MAAVDIDDAFAVVRQDLEAKLEELNGRIEPLRAELDELEGQAHKARMALSVLSDEDEDGSAHLRQPGALADRVSPAMRARMAGSGGGQELLKDRLTEVMPRLEGAHSSGAILTALDAAGYTNVSNWTLKRAIDGLVEEGLVEIQGTGAGTRYIWAGEPAPRSGGQGQGPRLSAQERIALEVALEAEVKREPRNAPELHRAIVALGVTSKEGTVKAILREWRNQGKVEMIETTPGVINTRVWQWVEAEATGNGGAPKAMAGSLEG